MKIKIKIKEKQRRIIKLISITVFAIFCLGFAAFNIFNFVYEDRQIQVYENERYIIGVYEEKVAIFAQGDGVPIEVYDVYVSTLPETDQKELKKGVEVFGKAKLKLLIEDYTS